MNKYLKLFKTEDDFKSCLEAKIGGDNTEMGFPNVSVIGAEDSNGNFSASKVHYIKDLTKAQAIREQLRPGRWVNPTTIKIKLDGADVKTLYMYIYNGLGGGGYPETLYTVRFQPYDWYDKKTNTTYYAFISEDAYENITKSDGIKNVLDGKDVALNLLLGKNGHNPVPRFSSYDPNNPVPPYHGKIVYVKDLSNAHKEVYEREFTVDEQGNLTFSDNINPFDSDGADFSTDFSSLRYSYTIDGYYNLDSGSGNGN